MRDRLGREIEVYDEVVFPSPQGSVHGLEIARVEGVTKNRITVSYTIPLSGNQFLHETIEISDSSHIVLVGRI